MAVRGPRRPAPLIALAANDGWSVVNHRAGLIAALIAAGYRVLVLAPKGNEAQAIRRLGAQFTAVPMDRRGTSPLADLRTLAAFARTLRTARPDAVLGFTIKPNIYGSLAARILGIPVINNITGLGEMFAGRGLLNRLVTGFYRLALGRSATVFFQNRDDRDLFFARRLVRQDQARLLPGSGVDLDRFVPPDRPRSAGPLRFLFAGRLLWDKGVGVYADAARDLRRRGSDARFQILGPFEPAGPKAVPKEAVERWVAAGDVDYLGAASDVRDTLADADCVVLPSYYREGVPKILLEAAAMGRPVITTDSIGCRDAVDAGSTGFLVEPRSVASLVTRMQEFAAMSASERAAMGTAARAKMERQYDEHLVHRAYLDALLGLGVSPD